MAKSDPEVYLVTMAGQYIGSNTANSTDLKPYEITVAMEEDMVDGEKTSAQSVFKNSLAAELMPLKYPDFTALYTYNIKEATTVSGAPVRFIQLKNRQQLREMVEEKRLPVQVELYSDTDALREAVILCQREPEAFKMQQDDLRDKRGAKIIIKSRALQLNEETARILREQGHINADSMSHVVSLDAAGDPVPTDAEVSASAKKKAAQAIKDNAKKDPAADI